MASHSKFAKKLNEYLTKAEREAPWLAKKLGMNPSTVLRWCNGETRPNSPEKIIEIARILGITSSDYCEELIKEAGYRINDRIRGNIKKSLVDPSDMKIPHAVTLELPAIVARQAEKSQVMLPVFSQDQGRKLTALEIPPEAPSETLIVIATFFVSAGNRDTLVHREIRNKIREETQNLNDIVLRVETISTVLMSDQRDAAEALGKHYHASMVIWGDDTGARITVNFLNIRQPDFYGAKVTISETEYTQIASPSAYNQFVIDGLPRKLTFLAFVAIGQSYKLHKNYTHSLIMIEAAIALSNPPVKLIGLADAYFHLGWLYHIKKPNNLTKSILNYDQAIVLEPGFASAYINRGCALREKGKLEEAMADLNQAIALEPDSANAYDHRGHIYKEQGKLEKEIADRNQAIALAPDSSHLYYNRGNTYKDQGKLEEAITDYGQAIALDPSFASAYHNRACVNSAYYFQEKAEEAITDYGRAIALDPDSSHAHFGRGLVYEIQGKLEQAIADFDKAIALNPNYAVAHYHRGCVYTTQRRLDQAIADFDKAIALNPYDAQFYNDRGVVRKIQGQLEEAMADLGKAIGLNPNNARAYYNRGLAYATEDKLEEAIIDFDQAITLNPDNADACYSRGVAYSKQEKLEKAITDYNRALVINPDCVGAYIGRGHINITLGRLEEAISDYNKAIALDFSVHMSYLYLLARRIGLLQLERRYAKNPEMVERLIDDIAE